MSEKYCDEHDEDFSLFRKKLFYILIALLVLILFTIFLIWAILRPSRPRIVLQDATIFNFNLNTSPNGLNYLNATIQVTLACHNSNKRIGILFQKIDVSAKYKHEQLTLPTACPSGYLLPNDDVVWTPSLYSVYTPLAPYLAAQLALDQQMQVVMLEVKLNGKIKWKVGAWMSGVYHLYATCPAYIALRSGQAGTGSGVGQGVKLQLDAGCGVEVALGG